MLFQILIAVLKSPFNIIYSIKWVISYVTIYLYNACNSRRFDLYDIKATGDPVKLGYLIPQLEKDLESPFPEPHLHNAADEILFYGVNSKSECILLWITRDVSGKAEAWIYLKLANGKTYHLVDKLGDQQPSEVNSTFSCGNLQMHYLSPMRRWRIFYCGMLRETQSETEAGESVFVKFVFLWKASSDVYDLSLVTNPEGFASAFARSKWEIPFVPPIHKFTNAFDFYMQPGILHGTISFNEGAEYEMYLIGEKMRNLGKRDVITGCKFTNILGNISETGLAFHVGLATAPFAFRSLPYGFVVSPDGNLQEVKNVKINITSSAEMNSRKILKANFMSNDKYEIIGTSIYAPIVKSEGRSGFLEICLMEFSLENRKGCGLIVSGEIHKVAKNSIKSIPRIQFPKVIPLTVEFSEDVAQFVEISGGKGSSLGKLAQLRKERKTFKVAKGIIVTTAAFKEFLTPEINNAVKYLEHIIYGNAVGDVKEVCKLVSDTVEKACLPKKICQSIIRDLENIFGVEAYYKKFAVRSSAVGEDSSTMSSAGQMETFLGVQGGEEIFTAVKKCWASQFHYTAIEYKRFNGQTLNSPMAVVIQEMIACEISGVLFTCNPVTSNPSSITITANYGLGESVVSGSVEPDTIVLRRQGNGFLDIKSVEIGAKHQKIVMQEFSGTVTEDLPETLKHESCLSDETAIRLGKVGIEIENFYKSPRDIEWGVQEDKIYIFQSRPITSVAGVTDFEIKHEFDTPLRCEREYITVANVGEIMPGATSPLGMEVLIKMFHTAIGKQADANGQPDNFKKNQYFGTVFHWTFYNHIMMSVIGFLSRYGVDTPTGKGMMVSIFGRILDDPELVDYAREKASKMKAPPRSLKTIFQFYWNLFFHAYDTDKIKEKYEKYHLNFLKPKTSKEVFKALMNSCSDFDEGIFKHIISSESSSQWNMYLFRILCNAVGEINPVTYGHFGKLLATSLKVESADVPRAMQELAFQIDQDLNIEDFKSMPLEDAECWLKTSASDAGYRFREFLRKHGHRCLKESDVYSVTWAMDPKPLMQLLQSLVGACKDYGKQKEDNRDEEIFSELNIDLDFWSRLKLKFIIPNCLQAVYGREAGKSLTIKGVDYWRQGYRHLAKLMVSEGRIPDEDLLFFFTLNEIVELLTSRSPQIISRALHRRRLFPQLNEYKFPEIMKGLPKPVTDKDESTEDFESVTDLRMEGIPVSRGMSKGFARVALTLAEASDLKPGEILITHSTDIGWSPYFPIISGIVTELGGIISHGAVVSREYGLPCIVGLHGATKRFHTGDYVLLDGNKGILQKLPKPE